MSTKPANILEPPSPQHSAAFRDGFGQRFLVTVDTEEEFDWNAPMDRTSHGLSAVGRLADFQAFCEPRGVAPLYLLDYPIATSPVARSILKPAVETGRAEIGLHLHPWVNPPFEEELSPRNSYAGNLASEQERAKFSELCEAIEGNFGIRPRIYRAGRYGAGPDTAALLEDADFIIDTSVRAHFDYHADGGPDYRRHPLHPYWLGGERAVLELPVTTVFWGALRRWGSSLFPLASRIPRLPGALARTRLLERIALTPEGVAVGEAIRAIDVAVAAGLPVLVFSFHSPSLAPGHTPYVRTDEDLARFYTWWSAIFDHLASCGIAPTTVDEIAESVLLA